MTRQIKPSDGYDPDAVLANERLKRPWWLMPCGCDHRNNVWYRFQRVPDPNWPPHLKSAAQEQLQAEATRA